LTVGRLGGRNPYREAFVNTLTLVYIAVIFVAFYFLLIRPQQKRSKEQANLMASLKTGDRVVTVGGLFGTIERLDDEIVEVRIADGVVVDIARSAIARRVDSAGHVLDDDEAAEGEGVSEQALPSKPRSEDVVEPEVHVGHPSGDEPQPGDDSGDDETKKDQ
jgi:preprotein translocase subunit YajC